MTGPRLLVTWTSSGGSGQDGMAPAHQGHYVARRTQEGLSKKEIIRCLKWYVARGIFHVLVATRELAQAA